MRSLLLISVTAIGLLLGGCDPIDKTTHIVATAPDGTQLWIAWSEEVGRHVFFSVTGTDTTHAERVGKLTVEVPDHVPASTCR